MNPHLHRAAVACRIILGVVFILSGFTKTVDPWGTAIKISEYMNAFGFENLKYYRFGFAIWLCGAELMMGCMLLFRVRTPLISIFALAAMTLFTAITLVSALWLPVEDCGCFGDAIRLSPWQTLAKNLVLWPMSFILWLDARHGRLFPISRREVLLTLLFFSLSGGLGVYCYRHLPLIDFLPYSVGTDLRHRAIGYVAPEEEEEVETLLVYRDRTTGKSQTFTLEDTVWYDTERWEWVETRSSGEPVAVATTLTEFDVMDPEGNATDELLSAPGRLHLVCVASSDRLKPWCREHLERFISSALLRGEHVVGLTPEPLREVTFRSIGASPAIRFYNIDATTLVTMLRAWAGVVTLDDGVIVRKRNCRDVR